MNDKREMVEQEPKGIAESGYTICPAVDIFEDDAGITLLSDMPGVSKEGLTIQVDQDKLSIEGEMSIQAQDGMEPIYADVCSNRYQRRFSLSRGLDANEVDATLKDGLLTVRIPKRKEVQPRKIEVQAG